LKSKRTALFRAGVILLLLVIAGLMLIIGRGHTVYLDNKSMDYNGQTYAALYRVVAFVDGKQVASLSNRERGMATCIGQRFGMTLEVTKEKGGDEQSFTITLPLPYSMDGIIINLPTYLAGLPTDAYLSQFIPAPETSDDLDSESDVMPDDEIPSDEEFLGDI
jgi:hypothetical protein